MNIIRYEVNGKPALTEAQIARLQALREMPEEDIDLSDMPEVTDCSDARRGLLPCIEKELEQKRDSVRQAKLTMAGCLAQYAQPELVEREQEIMQEQLTQHLKEKHHVD
ncbi:MAG: hypothetical protein CR974_00385 [Gammaproteobacteria bacterium]|nr:MAG: hypothetical protein CR974_00385 [Gammaproteobacteria bacterium]